MAFLPDDHRCTRLLCRLICSVAFWFWSKKLHRPRFRLVISLIQLHHLPASPSLASAARETSWNWTPDAPLSTLWFTNVSHSQNSPVTWRAWFKETRFVLAIQPQESRHHAFVQISALPSSTSKVGFHPPFLSCKLQWLGRPLYLWPPYRLSPSLSARVARGTANLCGILRRNIPLSSETLLKQSASPNRYPNCTSATRKSSAETWLRVVLTVYPT